MPYDIQTNAFLPYMLVALTYLAILAMGGRQRDRLAFILMLAFCVALGLRDTNKMSIWADPVWYAAILTRQIPQSAILAKGGVDYSIFFLVHGLTSRVLNYSSAFFLLNILYVPPLYLLYRLTREMEGMFFLLAGWLLFINSGILLLTNFFRQGQATLYLLVLILAFSIPAGAQWIRGIGAVLLPLLHISSAPFAFGLFAQKRRRFYQVFSITFSAFIVLAYIYLKASPQYAEYFSDPNAAFFTRDLWIKIIGAYAILACGFFIARKIDFNASEAAGRIKHTAVGLLIPTAALAFFAWSAPQLGTRFIYYFHAIAFLYIALVVAARKSRELFTASALVFCFFGAITWTYPTVTVLLKW